MDFKSIHENGVVDNPQISTPSKNLTGNHGETSRKTPLGKTKPRLSSEIKTKKPKLPLYSNKKANKNNKGKQVTVDDILKPVKSLDDGVVSKNHKPSFRKSDVKQLMPSSLLETAFGEAECPDSKYSVASKNDAESYVARALLDLHGSTPSSSQDEDSESIVPFHSQLLCKDNRPALSQDFKHGSQGETVRQSLIHASVSEEGCQNRNPFESEANAAPSVLDVSDFLTCTNGRWKKGNYHFTNPGILLLNTAEISKNEKAQNHSMTVDPSATQETAGGVNSFTEKTGSLNVDAAANGASLKVQLSFTDTSDRRRCTTRYESSDGKLLGNLHATQIAYDSVQDSTSALPSSSQDRLETEPIPKGNSLAGTQFKPTLETPTALPRGVSENLNSDYQGAELVFTRTSHKTPEKPSAPGLQISSPTKHPEFSGSHLYNNGGSGGFAVSPVVPVSTAGGAPIATQSLVTSTAVAGNDLPLFSTAGGRKMPIPEASNLDKYRAVFNQCCDQPVESNPGTSPSERDCFEKYLLDSSENKPLNSKMVFGENIPKSLCKKPQYTRGSAQVDMTAKSHVTSSTMPRNDLPLFSTAGGKKMASPKVSNLDKYRAVLNQCCDHPAESHPQKSVPETSTSEKDFSGEVLLYCSESKLLNSNTVVIGENTPKSSREKPQYTRGSANMYIAAQSPATSTTMPCNSLPLFSTAGGKKMAIPKASNLDKYRLVLSQCSGPPIEPNPQECISGASTDVHIQAGAREINKNLLETSTRYLQNSQVVQSVGSGNGSNKNTPKSSCKKPQLDSFLEGDAELFERLQTPSKCMQVDGISSEASNGVGDGKITEEHGVGGDVNAKCSRLIKEAGSLSDESEIDNIFDVLDSDFDYENIPKSPVLTLDETFLERNKVAPGESSIALPVLPSLDGSLLPSFKSVSGNKTALSKKNWEEAKTMYCDVFNKGVSDHLDQQDTSNATPVEKQDAAKWKIQESEDIAQLEKFQIAESGPLFGFASAGGKAVRPSVESLKRAEVSLGIFKDHDGLDFKVDDENMPGSPVLIVSNSDLGGNKAVPREPPPRSDSRLLPSFKSADGNSILLHVTSLEKARTVFNDDCNGLNDCRLDIHDPSLVAVGEQVRIPSRISNFEKDSGLKDEEKSGDSAQVTKQLVPPKESCSEWEEFPELKSSQAALLEQSASKKENISLAANQQTLDASQVDVQTVHGETRNSETCLKPNTPLPSVNSDMCKVNASTPLSSRTPFNPVVGTKRKSLPVAIEFAAKKPRPSPQDIKALFPKDDVTRSNLKTRVNHIITSKKKLKITSAPGILFQKKCNSPQLKLNLLNQYKLNDEEVLVEASDSFEHCAYDSALHITSENAVHFRFHVSAKDSTTGELMADSCFVLPNTDGTAGLEEVTTAFLTSPHVDPKLVPDGWVKNHYRWIVWKLACYERRFPQLFSESCLSVDNVLLQLKYRYDREIDRVERSAFKKLLEGDSAPKKFICCVAAVKKNRLDEGESLLEFELTDGWYSIWAVIDNAMVALYQKGIIEIGTKLVVHGAEMANCEQGCDPLNVPSDVKLKISTNSVRRAKWFAKMGFLRTNTPIPSLLCDVLPEGGIVGKLTTVVVRKYPIIYMCKDANGKTVFRNERSQAAFQDQLEKLKSDYAEVVQEKLFKEAESRYIPSKQRKPYTAEEMAGINDPEDLYSIWSAVGDDGEFMQSQLSADQFRLILNYKDEIASKIRSDVQKELQGLLAEWESNSKVTKLLKVRLMDCSSEKHAVLSIWRPSEDDSSAISENRAFIFFNIVANATRDGVLQLSSTRQTTLEDLPIESVRYLQPTKDFERVVTSLSAVQSSNFTPAFGELDTVGVVVLKKLPEQSSGVTVVYLSDLEGHYLSITFWTSLSVFGCEDLMTEGSLIACSNLQWRSLSSQRKRIPSVFASEITSFAKNPKLNHLRLHLQRMKSSLANKDIRESVSFAKTQILQATKSRDGPSCGVGSPALPARSPAASTPVRSTPVGNTLAGQTPISALSKSTPASASSESTPAGQKLRMLNQFGDAPPLTPMPLTVTTRQVFQNFKSPCVTPKRSCKP